MSVQFGTHYRKLFSVVALLQLLSLGVNSDSVTVFLRERHSSSPGLSLFLLLTSTLPGPSASAVKTSWRYTNVLIIIFLTLGRYVPEGV